MSYKQVYWRRKVPTEGELNSVRHVICQTCCRVIGDAITGADGKDVAKKMREVARRHRRSTGHKSFFFGDGIRRSKSGGKKGDS